VCGPVSARYQTLASDGALSMIGEDGSLQDPPGHGAAFSERTPQAFAL